MKIHRWQAGLIAGVPLLLAGCASAHASSAVTPKSSMSMTPGMSMAPGMSMPPGMSMAPGMSMPPGMSMATMGKTTQPSQSALMVCAPGIRRDVTMIASLTAAPPVSATWVNQLYTCSYHLPQGVLTLSVKEAGAPAAARSYFNAVQHSLGNAQPLAGAEGLGLPAFQTATGNVVFLKDDKTLQVDATGLPNRIGSQHRSRSDVAYTLATDVLGCWAGD